MASHNKYISDIVPSWLHYTIKKCQNDLFLLSQYEKYHSFILSMLWLVCWVTLSCMSTIKRLVVQFRCLVSKEFRDKISSARNYKDYCHVTEYIKVWKRSGSGYKLQVSICIPRQLPKTVGVAWIQTLVVKEDNLNFGQLFFVHHMGNFLGNQVTGLQLAVRLL